MVDEVWVGPPSFAADFADDLRKMSSGAGQRGKALRRTSGATDNDGDEERFTGYRAFGRERGPGKRLRM